MDKDFGLDIENFGDKDKKLILSAYEFAKNAHRGQKRLSGDDYIIHPITVAKSLISLGLDASTVSAGLLHDVPEDTDFSIDDIKKNFSDEIANLVLGVTKVNKIRIKKDWYEAESTDIDTFYSFPRQIAVLQRMFIAMSEDIRVILIKLCDRLHNMQTIEFLPESKKMRIARETLEIFAPLADRLGIGVIKGELEDLSFPIAHPKEYQKLKKDFGKTYEFRKTYVKRMKKYLQKELYEVGVAAEIHGRAKFLYSLFKKLKKYDGTTSRIYDLVALRVIVNDVKDCYAVLGYIHQLFKPLPTKIKDYIAMPKPNGYQSIHTTVFGLEGQIIEIQIRTFEMHEHAEYGVAAHWHYTKQVGPKEEIEKKGIFAPKKDLDWTKELADWQKKAETSQDFKELKNEFFQDRIFVFTPKGDVCDLPFGATTIDFAYWIHTDLGNNCAGAKVNGKMVELSFKLSNGDIVEIITRKNTYGPKRDWLNFVKTSQAKMHIKQYLLKKVI